jgi:pyruvate dehydrogenase (quinone)
LRKWRLFKDYSPSRCIYDKDDADLIRLAKTALAIYNYIIVVPEQAEVAVDIACRTALAQRGVSHLTIPIDVQEKKLSGKYSKHNESQ